MKRKVKRSRQLVLPPAWNTAIAVPAPNTQPDRNLGAEGAGLQPLGGKGTREDLLGGWGGHS